MIQLHDLIKINLHWSFTNVCWTHVLHTSRLPGNDSSRPDSPGSVSSVSLPPGPPPLPPGPRQRCKSCQICCMHVCHANACVCWYLCQYNVTETHIAIIELLLLQIHLNQSDIKSKYLIICVCHWLYTIAGLFQLEGVHHLLVHGWVKLASMFM